MKSFFAALQTLTLPFGVSSGVRLVLDGTTGTISGYDAGNNLVFQLSGTIAQWGTISPAGVRVQIDGAAGELYVRDSGNNIVVRLQATPTPDVLVNGVSVVAPAGMIVAYGGTSAPSGYLLCDGSAVSRTTFSRLFTAIGTAFGAGDGSTTFNVPDLRQRFPLGKAAAGTGSTLGGTGGAIDHTHSTPAHSHSLDGATGYAKVFIGSVSKNIRMLRRTVASWTDTHGLDGTGFVAETVANTLAADLGGDTSSDGSGTSGSTNPPFQAVNYIIKT